jgi:hypothetical protein
MTVGPHRLAAKDPVLPLLHSRPRLGDAHRDLTPLPGEPAASLGGSCIVSAGLRVEAMGVGGKGLDRYA